jgi:hypothetical protein
MTSNQIWVFLGTTIQQSPWLMVLMCFGVILFPGIILSLLAALEHFLTPSAARKPFGHRYKGMEKMDGPLLQIYYKTAGLAAILLILITIVYHGLAPTKAFLFGW